MSTSPATAISTPHSHTAPASFEAGGWRRQFVEWLRAVAPYIHAYRGKTMVVAFSGELAMEGRLNTLVHDVSLLHAMGMRLVVVHGSRPQVQEQLRLRGAEGQFANGVRITDAIALESAKEAAGELRLDIEAAFSQGLPNTPMGNASIRLVSGNFVTAKPVGVIDGIDHLHTGVVRKIDANAIDMALKTGAVVLLSPLGFSPTGEAFNLAMEDLACSAAVALDADKLIFVSETPGVLDENNNVRTEISEAEATRLLAEQQAELALPEATANYLRYALKACEGGVARAHILPFALDGSVLLEIFTHDGVGTMVVEETLEELREATIDDLGGIIAIIKPLEDQGVLVKRDRSLLEREIEGFSVIEHDGVIWGCAMLHAYSAERMGEMACLAVHPQVQGQGDGDRILKRIEQRARAAGLTRLFVLTTRTAHWFLKRGFIQSTVDDLPQEKRAFYNPGRKSLIFIKNL
jgi:amino-acid N-acetyltransferase